MSDHSEDRTLIDKTINGVAKLIAEQEARLKDQLLAIARNPDCPDALSALMSVAHGRITLLEYQLAAAEEAIRELVKEGR